MFQLENTAKSGNIIELATTGWIMMAVSKFERKVYLWRFTPRVRPKEANQTATLAEIMGLVEVLYKSGKANVHVAENGQILDDASPLKDDKNQLYLADFEQTNASFVLLFNRGDPTAANPAFLSKLQSQVRSVLPTGDAPIKWIQATLMKRCATLRWI
jgi:hypothetical protein